MTRWFGPNTDVEVERTARAAAEAAAARTQELQLLTAELAAAVTVNDVAEVVVAAGESVTGRGDERDPPDPPGFVRVVSILRAAGMETT